MSLVERRGKGKIGCACKTSEPDGFFFKGFIYSFLEREREGEREGEKHQCVVASHASPTGDLACNPGMCPDWDSN